MKKPKRLQATAATKHKLTFNAPHILLEHDLKKNKAFPVLTLRRGGSVQIEFTTTVDIYDAPVDESGQVFKIKAFNEYNFANEIVQVLNDAMPHIHLVASSPTASEYLKLVGKKVMTNFSCQRSPAHSEQFGKDAYLVRRTTIILP